MVGFAGKQNENSLLTEHMTTIIAVDSALGRIQKAHAVLSAITSAELCRMEKGPRDGVNEARENLWSVLGSLACPQADGDPAQLPLLTKG